MSGFYQVTVLVVLTVCLLSPCSANVGDYCTISDTSNCATGSEQCVGNNCNCLPTHYQSGRTCLIKVAINGDCSSTESATEQCIDVNAQCTASVGGHKCLCKSTHYLNTGNVCTAKVTINGDCLSTESATVQCIDANAECTDSGGGHKCLCKSTHYLNKGDVCTAKVAINGDCLSTESATVQCIDANAECTDSGGGHKCLCKSTHYLNTGDVCTAKVAINGDCSSTETATEQCIDANAECTDSGGGHKCLCKSTHYLNKGDVCTAKVAINGDCLSTESATVQCIDANAECTDSGGGHKCLCKSTHYLNTGDVCTAKVAINGDCSSTETATEQCIDANAECTDSGGGHKCLCKSTHYLNKGDVCTAKVTINGDCLSTESATVQCIDANAECTDSVGGHKCLCKSTHYLNKGDVCTAKVAINGDCLSTESATVQCIDVNAQCTASVGGYKCLCKSTHYLNKGDVCTAKVTINGDCLSSESATVQCIDVNAQCTASVGGYKCLCKSTHYLNKGDVCTAKVAINGDCSSTETATEQCIDANAECTDSGGGHKCLCKSTHYLNKGDVCTAKVTINGDCLSTESATVQCIDANAECTDSVGGHKCLCKSTHYLNKGDVCTAKVAINGDCSSTESATVQCIDVNAQCTASVGGYKCLCKSTHYLNKGDVCTAKVAINGDCLSTESATVQCIDANAECTDSGGGHKCLCKSTHYLNTGNVCTAKVTINGDCLSTETATEQCIDANAQCTASVGGHKCLCKSTHYLNTGDVCTAKVAINGDCLSTEIATVQCIDANAECTDSSGGHKCLCKSTHYLNTGDVCTAKSGLSEPCINGEPANQCSVTNSECIADKAAVFRCFCKPSFYAKINTCSPLTELQVNSLNVPDSTTSETSFIVTWTIPVTVSYINNYLLAIDTEDPINIPPDTSVTQYVVTSRVPGKKYSITLKSVETKSRPTPQETSVSIIDGTRPAVPGIIQSVDLGAPSISLLWTINGDIEYLSGSINDSTITPNVFNQSATVSHKSPTVNFGGCKHGQHYTITAIAHSNNLDSSQSKQEIRTTPIQPSPPQNLTCISSNIFDRDLILTWAEPISPNGYIQNYIIWDSIRNRNIQTNGSVLKQEIDGLEPESDYFFAIATVNDAVTTSNTSGYTGSITCRTKTALASKPENVVLSESHDSITATWDPPSIPGGQIIGYRLTVKNITTSSDEICSQEIILLCRSCVNNQDPPFETSCTIKEVLERTINEINGIGISYTITRLAPFVQYSVRIQAINAKGSGNPSIVEKTTLQTVPLKPVNIRANNLPSDPKKLNLVWEQPLPRPGITTYTIDVYEADDTGTRFIKKPNFGKTNTGYYTQSVVIEELEEYWDYKFEVTASTVIGSMKSDQSDAFKTYHAKPGPVINFTVANPIKIYTQMVVKWNIPPMRDRNSVIKEYKLIHNITGIEQTVTVPSNNEISHQRTFNVTAEQLYKIQIMAVNTENQDGTVKTVYYQAHRGPPVVPTIPAVGVEDNKPVISLTFTVKFSLSWFSNTENGQRTDAGFIFCPAESCDDYGYKDNLEAKAYDYFSDTNKITTWKKSKAIGFKEAYRITNSTWIQSYGIGRRRRRRSTYNAELVIGEDTDCDTRDENEYCNGPLPPATSFRIVAFVCSAGGCTESEQYGPFITPQVTDESSGLHECAGWIGALVGAFVAIQIVEIVILCMYRRKGFFIKKERVYEDVKGQHTDGHVYSSMQTFGSSINGEDSDHYINDIR